MEQSFDYVRGRVFSGFSLHRARVCSDEPTEFVVKVRNRAASPEQKIRRDVFQSWFRMAASETRPGSKSSCPLSDFAFDDAKLVRAVNDLPDGQNHWVKYAYCPDGGFTWDDEAGAVLALWELYKPQIGKVRGDTEKKLKGLAHLCIQDMRSKCNRGKPLHKPARLQEVLGVAPSTWREVWLPRWRAMQALVSEMDSQALAVLYECIGALEHDAA